MKPHKPPRKPDFWKDLGYPSEDAYYNNDYWRKRKRKQKMENYRRKQEHLFHEEGGTKL